jgi:hypothetical protein
MIFGRILLSVSMIALTGCSVMEVKPSIQVEHLSGGRVNSDLSGAGYPTISRIPGLQLQTSAGSNRVQFGSDLSYRYIHTGDEPNAANNNNPNNVRLGVFSLGPMIRFYPYDGDFVRWDLHAGWGFSFVGLNGKKDGADVNMANGIGQQLYYGTGISFGYKNFYVGFDLGHREGRYLGARTSNGISDRLQTEGTYMGLTFTFTSRPSETRVSENRERTNSKPAPTRVRKNGRPAQKGPEFVQPKSPVEPVAPAGPVAPTAPSAPEAPADSGPEDVPL